MKISAKVTIEGTKPLLFHTFPIDTLSEKKAKSGTQGSAPEEWKNTVLMNEKRQLYVFDSYLVGAISGGAKEIKIGKGNLSKKVSSTVEVSPAKIFLDDLFVPEEKNLTKLDHEPVYLDIRAVVNPMTKGRNVRYRIAAKSGWCLSFIATWDDYIVSKDQMKVCIENGGMFAGIGDGRKIGFGKFMVTSFELHK